MARVIAGLGCSHSPALNMDPEVWFVRAEIQDRHRVPLYTTDGVRVTYEQLLASASPALAAELDPALMQSRYDANQRAVAEVARRLYEAEPDVLVMIGDDHYELFQDDNMPAISIFCGESLPYVYTGIVKWPYAPEYRTDLWYPDERRDYPVPAALARHVIGHVVEQGFDVSYSRSCRDGHGMSHSFAFVYWRLMRDKRIIPAIPVNINTYFPPNQVPPARCYGLGQALTAAIAAWPEDLRVLVIATGGLSHFVVDEELDRAFIDAVRARDPERIHGLPRQRLQGGNSEFRNWITLAGAVDHLRSVDVIDYVPCYRSPAGTGCAMGFIHWC